MRFSPIEIYRKFRRLPIRLAEAEREISKIEKRLEQKDKQISDLRKQNSELKKRLYGMEKQQEYLYASVVPASRYPEELGKWYYRQTGKRLDLDHPTTYNEKIQWFKLYGYTDETTRLVDKYKVRDYVASRIGESYLIPLLGVWKYPEQIDFDTLPDRFVLQANHGCGYYYIVTDKSTLDREDILQKANQWLETDFSFHTGFEMQYHQIERCLFAEQYLENTEGDLYDYKVWCFNGRAEYIMFQSNRKDDMRMDIFDREWNLMTFSRGYKNSDIPPARPDNLDEMLSVAEKLADGFPHVRVDLYRMESGKLYFGEMTFTPSSGRRAWTPPEMDLIMGQKFDYTDDYARR